MLLQSMELIGERLFPSARWNVRTRDIAASVGIVAATLASSSANGSTIAPAEPRDVPGLVYQHAKVLHFLVPQTGAAPAHVGAVVKLSRQGMDMAVDFDSGASLGPWARFGSMGSIVESSKGRREVIDVCDYVCISSDPWTGVVDGKRVKLESRPIALRFAGEPLDLGAYVQGPDPRAGQGYTALRAVAEDGSVLWDKVYLVATRGASYSSRDLVVTRDLVESASEVGFAHKGDDVAYVQHVAATSLEFGSVLVRISLRDGALTGYHPRLKADDADSVRQLLQQALDGLPERERSRGAHDTPAATRSTTHSFHSTGDVVADLPALLDWTLRTRYFPSR